MSVCDVGGAGEERGIYSQVHFSFSLTALAKGRRELGKARGGKGKEGKKGKKREGKRGEEGGHEQYCTFLCRQ